VFGDPGRSRRKTPGCNAPIGVGDPGAVHADVDNLKAAFDTVQGRAARCATLCGTFQAVGGIRDKEQIDTRWNHASALAARMGIRWIAREHKVAISLRSRIRAVLVFSDGG
jgi:hypothetical protein